MQQWLPNPPAQVLTAFLPPPEEMEIMVVTIETGARDQSNEVNGTNEMGDIYGFVFLHLTALTQRNVSNIWPAHLNACNSSRSRL